MFLLSTEKNKLVVLQKTIITSGSVNVYDVRFQFDSDWDGMTRYAVFRVGDERVSIVLDDTNSCKIPWECLRSNDIGEDLYVGVYGMVGETTVLPTIWARMGNISEGTKLGDTALPPTPSVAEQILAQILAARDETLAARDEVLESGGVASDDEVNDALDDALQGETEGDDTGSGSEGDDTGSGSEGDDTGSESEGDDTIDEDNVATDEEVNDMFDDIFGT